MVQAPSRRKRSIGNGHDVCQVRAIHPARLARVRRGIESAEELRRSSELFDALSQPSRVAILRALCIEAELCVCDLAALLGISVSAVSHQLRILRHLHLVGYRREGKMAYYWLDDDHVRGLIEAALDHARHA